VFVFFGLFVYLCVNDQSGGQAWNWGVVDTDTPLPLTVSTAVSASPVEVAGKTNSAFVFVKPSACCANVVSLVKEAFGKAKITITSEGELGHKAIDQKMLIDTHYGAIANRAVKQKPADLIVPEKGQQGFEKLFGIKWVDAVKQGLVYNAKDACVKLNVDGEGLEKQWRGAEAGKLIKFGGGFYACKIGDIYVINGFYMAMRASYTTPPAPIHYFTVEWPAATLSWADFRGKVLGATDPTKAAAGSVRRSILEQYVALGLTTKPNTGDNGVHASASPFEALAERMNWLGQPIETDAYGKGLLAAGVPKTMLQSWTQDPAVAFNGTKGSLFDLLEDMNAAPCIAKARSIALAQGTTTTTSGASGAAVL